MMFRVTHSWSIVPPRVIMKTTWDVCLTELFEGKVDHKQKLLNKNKTTFLTGSTALSPLPHACSRLRIVAAKMLYFHMSFPLYLNPQLVY